MLPESSRCFYNASRPKVGDIFCIRKWPTCLTIDDRFQPATTLNYWPLWFNGQFQEPYSFQHRQLWNFTGHFRLDSFLHLQIWVFVISGLFSSLLIGDFRLIWFDFRSLFRYFNLKIIFLKSVRPEQAIHRTKQILHSTKYCPTTPLSRDFQTTGAPSRGQLCQKSIPF